MSHKTSGSSSVGDGVYFFLPEGSPNAGKPRFAIVARVPQNQQLVAGQRAEAVDLKVIGALAEDQIIEEQLNVPHTQVGTRDPGTWGFVSPEASGF